MLTADIAASDHPSAGPHTLAADTGALAAAAGVAARQGDHADLMRDYVARHLSRLESFSGVLGLFREQYAAALAAALAGLGASAGRAESLAGACATTRRELLAADDAARGDLRRLLGALGPGVPSDPLALPGMPEELAGVRDQVRTLADEVGEIAGTVEDLAAYERFAGSAR